MLEQFKLHLAEQGLCGPGERVLLAVSGGVDSVVMAHLFAETHPGMGAECAIAHCNFQLRGTDSDADEAFVRELGALLEMPVYVKLFDVEHEVEDRGVSVQMAARDLRYVWFDELAGQHGFDAVATAHNLNDSVETFLINLARGTGIRGLTGIPPRNGKVIRPLLFASRADIEDYASVKGIPFREDSTNRETKYHRNKIRHDVIPSMERINPAFIDTMAENMKRLDGSRSLLDQAVRRIRRELFAGDAGEIHIDAGKLRELSPRHAWLYELFSPFGFTRAQCAGMGQILTASPGKRFISPTHQLYKDRDLLILVEVARDSLERYYLDSPEKHSSLPFAMDVELLDRDKLGTIPRSRSIACLDYDLIQFPLTIRHWLHGDYFHPLGMEQNKKLSDFFVDQKVPVPEKERIWILASGRKIVWVMGHRIDHRFRITEDTRRVLRLSLQ